jgi:uridine monophosphate synthetase
MQATVATPLKEARGYPDTPPKESASNLKASTGMISKQSPFFELLKRRVDEVDSLLCVGLDPHVKQLPEPSCAAAERHSLDLITATKDVAACYKPNAAFFECWGEEGAAALKRVIAAAKATGAPVLLDAKRGDIGTTSDAYAVSAFDELDADAITLSPYMGWDSLSPFVDEPKGYGATKGAFVLCKTSNPSSADIQTLKTVGTGQCVFERVAALTVPGKDWNRHSNVGLVVGATDIDAISAVRRVNSSAWILAPGVGAQGGDLDACCQAAITQDGYGLLLPISRGISAAADPAEAARNFRDCINTMRKGKSGAQEVSNVFLQPFQREFIDLALSSNVLRFGEFTLKSGRSSPYFFNAGLFNTGRAQGKLCSAYAARIASSDLKFDVIFGPAYKGIGLAAGVAAALFAEYGLDYGYAYNRKEVKDHGEGGCLVGADVAGKRCLLIDDVISAGTAVREAKAILDSAKAELAGVVVALDRQEKTGKDGELSEISAIQSVQEEFGVPVHSIVGLDGLLSYLETLGGAHGLAEHADAVRAYRKRYGVEPSA